MPRKLYVALLHHPVRGRDGGTITTSVTNLDVHDIARSSRTYGVESYFVVTPIEAQQTLVRHILGYWHEGDGARRVPERADALDRVRVVASLEEVLAAVGAGATVVTTAARPRDQSTTFEEARVRLRDGGSEPWVLVFGTGHGLADSVLERAAIHLRPVRPEGYNHLSVRSAAAIILDRLLGDEALA